MKPCRQPGRGGAAAGITDHSFLAERASDWTGETPPAPGGRRASGRLEGWDGRGRECLGGGQVGGGAPGERRAGRWLTSAAVIDKKGIDEEGDGVVDVQRGQHLDQPTPAPRRTPAPALIEPESQIDVAAQLVEVVVAEQPASLPAGDGTNVAKRSNHPEEADGADERQTGLGRRRRG